MNITFYGGVREVTGSMHLMTTENDKILLDCGMFQGRRKKSEQQNRVLPFDPGIITNIVLSHAHIDHSGRIPMLTKENFNGHIICTRPTVDVCEYLLPDSAHIQESDANYLNYKTVRSTLYQLKTSPRTKQLSKRQVKNIKLLLKKNQNKINTEIINELIEKYHIEGVYPIYTIEDSERSLKYFEGYPYKHPVHIGNDIICTFYDAGHILGSAISIIKVTEKNLKYTICYTGDIGRFNKPILKDPTLNFAEEDRDIDLLIMESTYGNRFHEPVKNLGPQLKKVIIETVDRGGSILIPSFAFGRTQDLLYAIHELYNKGEVPRIPIYVDSPLATKITRVFGEHPEVYDKETHKTFLENGENPFLFEQVHFISSVEESMALMREKKSHIVISASGMCEAGRILHHLRYKIHNPQHTILIVGYMAQNTLGRRILEQGEEYENSGRSGSPPILKFLNKTYPLKAHVVKIDGFSAHGDRNELVHFLKKSNLKIKKIALIHGEENQSISFADYLGNNGFSVITPNMGETINIK